MPSGLSLLLVEAVLVVIVAHSYRDVVVEGVDYPVVNAEGLHLGGDGVA
jgi:hypothetical protein